MGDRKSGWETPGTECNPVCYSRHPDLHAYKDKFMFPNGNIGLRAALGMYMYTNDRLKTVEML